MARATRVDFLGAWYHVLNRGTERRAIFRSTRYYEKFIELLSSLPERFGVRLHGYGQSEWGRFYTLNSKKKNKIHRRLMRFSGKIGSQGRSLQSQKTKRLLPG